MTENDERKETEGVTETPNLHEQAYDEEFYECIVCGQEGYGSEAIEHERACVRAEDERAMEEEAERAYEQERAEAREDELRSREEDYRGY